MGTHGRYSSAIDSTRPALSASIRWPDGEVEGALAQLGESAARGRELAALLDPDTPVPDVTKGPLRSDMAALAVPSTTAGQNMSGDDFALTAGWGHFGSGDAVMPGQGNAIERPCTEEERTNLGDSLSSVGETTLDIYVNDSAFWRNVPVGASRMALQAGRLTSAQELALLPGARSPGSVAHPRPSPILRGNYQENRCNMRLGSRTTPGR